MQAAKALVSLRICADSPELSLSLMLYVPKSHAHAHIRSAGKGIFCNIYQTIPMLLQLWLSIGFVESSEITEA